MPSPSGSKLPSWATLPLSLSLSPPIYRLGLHGDQGVAMGPLLSSLPHLPWWMMRRLCHVASLVWLLGGGGGGDVLG